MQKIIETLHQALVSAHVKSAANGSADSPLYDEREVRSIIDLLIEEVCGITRIERILHPDWHPDEAQREEIRRIAQLLAQGIPVQQALGYEWFCGRKFRVTSDVLIPRPETAELIDWIVNTFAPSSQPTFPSPTLLDIGTGSGCIAITLARLINNSQVLALDLSTTAIDIARTNAYEQGVDNVYFAECDILKCESESYFQQVISGCQPTCQQQGNDSCQHQGIHCFHRFDVIVSNPPYICRKEAAEMSPLVLDHEPDMALFVPDDNPLLFYRAIARFALRHLTPQGRLFFEINAAYGPQTCQMLRDEGFGELEMRQDINGRDRMISACFQNLV